MPTIHLLGLAFSQLTREYESCAYTARTRTWATLMAARGWDVVAYAGDENETLGVASVPVVTRAEQAAWWPGYVPGPNDDFDPNSPGWRTVNERQAAAIRERARPGDILAITYGTTQRPVAMASASLGLVPVEIGVGYRGVWAPYRVYESRAWRHHLAAFEASDDHRVYDAVIPRGYDLADFPPGSGTGGYHLFMGRLIRRKGVETAVATCRALGIHMVIAGPGVSMAHPGRIMTTDGMVLEGDIEYAGVATPEERASLMGGAAAVWTPSRYLEPGGGVAIEAQLCGTPVIASDWGCFTETVEHGTTGWLCSTERDYRLAAESVADLDRIRIRAAAAERYGADAIGRRFDEYLGTLTRR